MRHQTGRKVTIEKYIYSAQSAAIRSRNPEHGSVAREKIEDKYVLPAERMLSNLIKTEKDRDNWCQYYKNMGLIGCHEDYFGDRVYS